LMHLMAFVPRGTRTLDHYILGQARCLRDRGWAVRYAFSAEPPPAYAADLAAAGATWTVVAFPFDRTAAKRLRQHNADFRPDVLVTSFMSPFNRSLLGLKLGGFARKLVVLDHASGVTPTRTGVRRLATWLRGRAVGRVIDALLPVSHANARRAVERVFLPARKVRVVHNGIRLDLFPAPPRPPRKILRVAYVGQLIPEKGVATLLAADAQLRAAGVTGYELLVAGKGPQEAELKALAHPSVQFLGHVDDVPALFGSADIVVVPSVWAEAFGLVVAEAMACGAAVLVSDAGALPEVVGGAGVVFRADDADDLAAKLRALLADSETRTRLGAAGRHRAFNYFDIDRSVRECVGVCEAVLEGQSIHHTIDGDRP
jgi:glycosyltransferase involved in cell wall biosynthesis